MCVCEHVQCVCMRVRVCAREEQTLTQAGEEGDGLTSCPIHSWSILMTQDPLQYDIASNISSTSDGGPTGT